MMEQDCLPSALQSFLQEPSVQFWAIGRTRFSTSTGGEQLQCRVSLPAQRPWLGCCQCPSLSHKQCWGRMVPLLGHLVTPGLLESHLHLQLKGLAFLPGRKHGIKMCPLHPCLPDKRLQFCNGKHQVRPPSQNSRSRG